MDLSGNIVDGYDLTGVGFKQQKLEVADGIIWTYNVTLPNSASISITVSNSYFLASPTLFLFDVFR